MTSAEQYDDQPYEAEFDAFGQNAGLANPYIHEPPDENGNGGILLPGGGTAGGTLVNGRVVNYAVDGIPVTRNDFMSYLEMAFPGGSFQILERSARLSARPIGYRKDVYPLIVQGSGKSPQIQPFDPNRPPSPYPTLPDGETPYAGTWTVVTPIYYNNNWSLDWSLLRHEQQNKYLTDYPKSVYSDARNTIKPKTDSYSR